MGKYRCTQDCLNGDAGWSSSYCGYSYRFQERWLPSYGLMAFVNGDAEHELIPRDEHQEMVRKQV